MKQNSLHDDQFVTNKAALQCKEGLSRCVEFHYEDETDIKQLMGIP